MRTPPPALWVVLLVVLAGCPSTADPEPAETVTPAPVPTPEFNYPPGVSESGVSGPGLAAAHERGLERTNYTLVIRQRIVERNRTVQRIEGTRRVLAGGETYVGEFRRSVSRFPLRRPANTIEYWSDDEVFAARQSRTGRLIYVGTSSGDPVADVDESRSLNRTVGALRFAVAKRENGSVALVITGLRDPGALPTPAYVYDARNVSGTVRVRADGVATAWRITYDAQLGDRQVRVTREVRFRNVGTTVVERPGWVDEARNQSEYSRSVARAGPAGTNRTP